jgi:dihydroorotate dehydrogenase
MFFIGPPFGNYINLPYTTQIKGSYTLEPRGGLFKQVIKTLRYDFNQNGWINKIGLRNPGIDYAIKNYNDNHIVSIAILNKNEIPIIEKKIPKNMNIELNASCPNAEKEMINDGLDIFLNKERKYCIIKLSPLCDIRLIDNYYKQGFRQFHCSNTLKTLYGGLSGISLIPYTNNLIKYLKKYDDVEIISGGGVRYYNDVLNYKKLGANSFSASTIFFNPFLSINLYMNYIYNLEK